MTEETMEIDDEMCNGVECPECNAITIGVAFYPNGCSNCGHSFGEK